MKKHQQIFVKFKTIFKIHFKGSVVLSEEKYNDYKEEFLKIDGTDIWMNCTEDELIYGFTNGMYRHYDLNHNLQYCKEITFEFISLLIKEQQVINYFKGQKCFKTEIYTKNKKGWILFGQSTYLFYPFWKRTKKEITIKKPLITSEIFIRDLKEITNLI